MRARGTDPKVSEQHVLHYLTNLDLTPAQMRSTMTMVLLCCYDRQVTRDFMLDMLERTAAINYVMAIMESEIRLELEKPDNKKAMDEGKDFPIKTPAIEAISANFRILKKQLADKFGMVMSCPTAADMIS